MGWTYSGDPQATPKDNVRYLIQDTNVAEQLITDEEIAYLLSEVDGLVYRAAINGALVIASKFSRMADETKSIGDLSINRSLSQKADAFRTVAQDLERRMFTNAPPIPNAARRALGAETIVGGFDYFEAWENVHLWPGQNVTGVTSMFGTSGGDERESDWDDGYWEGWDN